MDLVFSWRGHFNRGEDKFELLNDDTLGFKEVPVVLGVELFGAAKIDEAVELFPAFQIVLHLVNQLIELFVTHRLLRLISFCRYQIQMSFGCKEDNHTATQFAGS